MIEIVKWFWLEVLRLVLDFLIYERDFLGGCYLGGLDVIV